MRPLTDPQKALLGLLCRGLTNRQIGRLFGISEQAATARVDRLRAKFAAATRAQLVHLAYAWRVLEVPPKPPVRVPLDPPEVIAARRRVLLGEED
jgi:DNA-binding CsgD family transcriptional regulator